MELVTIKQFAESQEISYEAVRKQINRYSDELSGHIIKQGRKSFLDKWAVEFLETKRRERPVVLASIERTEENEYLREQIEKLKTQLLSAQNELLREKERVINLQEEAKKSLEASVRYTALLEESEAKDEKLKEAERREEDLTRALEEKDGQLEDLRNTVEDLSRERDEAQSEAQSYRPSIFGFYRKI